MKVWLSCFFGLFAIAELLQWAQHVTLPLPFYILCGAVLAVASNADKQLGFLPLKEEIKAIASSLQQKQFSSHKEPK